jgi:hypothetical protein
MGWEHAAFVQQIWSRTRVGSDQLFHHLPKCDGRSIERYLDTWLADDDARCAIECDTYLHGFALLKHAWCSSLALQDQARTPALPRSRITVNGPFSPRLERRGLNGRSFRGQDGLGYSTS